MGGIDRLGLCCLGWADRATHSIPRAATTKPTKQQVAVFDDAESDPAASILGLASVPLASLSRGEPVCGNFTLRHPVTGATAGAVRMRVEWVGALGAGGGGGGGGQPRMMQTVNTAAAAAADAAAASLQAAAVQHQRATPPPADPLPLTAAQLAPAAHLHQEQAAAAEQEAQQQQRHHHQQQPLSPSSQPLLFGRNISLTPPPEVHALAAARLQPRGSNALNPRLLPAGVVGGRAAGLEPPHPSPYNMTAVAAAAAASTFATAGLQPAAAIDAAGAEQQQQQQQNQLQIIEGSQQQHGAELLQQAEELLVHQRLLQQAQEDCNRTRCDQPGDAAAAVAAAVAGDDQDLEDAEQLLLAQDEQEREEEEDERLEYGLQQTASDAELAAAAAAVVSHENEEEEAAESSTDWVMTRVPPDDGPSTWRYSPERVVYLRVDGLELSGDALGDAGVTRTLVVAHSFLEAWTDAAAQCTEGVAKGCVLLVGGWGHWLGGVIEVHYSTWPPTQPIFTSNPFIFTSNPY